MLRLPSFSQTEEVLVLPLLPKLVKDPVRSVPPFSGTLCWGLARLIFFVFFLRKWFPVLKFGIMNSISLKNSTASSANCEIGSEFMIASTSARTDSTSHLNISQLQSAEKPSSLLKSISHTPTLPWSQWRNVLPLNPFPAAVICDCWICGCTLHNFLEHLTCCSEVQRVVTDNCPRHSPTSYESSQRV